jgi:hypothetical protein
MNEGINLDPTVLINVQSERIAASAIREAKLTAAVQQLTMEVMSLKEQWTAANTPVEPVLVEEEDASTDDSG